MSDLISATGAAARTADTLLHGVGGRAVMLRMPAPAVPDDATEQLGIAVPTFQDLPLLPVVFRKARATVAEGKTARFELLVSAVAVEALVGSLAYASGSVLFADAFGILVDDELFRITSATVEQVYGEPYVYRLVLQSPPVDLI